MHSRLAQDKPVLLIEVFSHNFIEILGTIDAETAQLELIKTVVIFKWYGQKSVIVLYTTLFFKYTIF